MLETGSFLQPLLGIYIPWMYADSFVWTGIGLLGNILFGSRILVQWIASEIKHQVVVPGGYWYLSFFGGLLNMLYAFHVDKLPIIIGSMAFLIYARNVWMMIARKRNAHPAN